MGHILMSSPSFIASFQANESDSEYHEAASFNRTKKKKNQLRHSLWQGVLSSLKMSLRLHQRLQAQGSPNCHGCSVSWKSWIPPSHFHFSSTMSSVPLSEQFSPSVPHVLTYHLGVIARMQTVWCLARYLAHKPLLIKDVSRVSILRHSSPC